jgi:hypothetical protein
LIDTRDAVFDRISVSYLVRGGATVTWSLRPHFLDPQPHSFQLRVGSTGDPAADDWANVGSPVLNAGLAIDSTRRGFGRLDSTHYRVVLTTPVGTYASRPVSTTGTMGRHDWLIARELVRQRRLQLRLYTAVPGRLLKRRFSGPMPSPTNPAVAVIDPTTGAMIRSTAASTAGTPFTGGYFASVPFLMSTSPASSRSMLDPQRGSVDDASLVVRGSAVMVPELSTGDLFVADGSDRRWYVERVTNAAEWRGVPLVADVELRRAPAGDPAYLVSP